MPRIEIPEFKGTMPAVASRNLPDANAQEAKNLNLNEGTLKALYQPSSVLELTGTDLRSFMKIRDDSGDEFWMTSIQADIEGAYSPVALLASERGRFYWTDGVRGFKSNFDLASQSGVLTNGSPDIYYYLDVPAVSGTPVATLQGAAGTDAIDDVVYVVTQVTEWGEECAPSLPTDVVSVYDDQHVHISGFDEPYLFGGPYNLAGFRIYRIVRNSQNSGEWQMMDALHDAGPTNTEYIQFCSLTSSGAGKITVSGVNITRTAGNALNGYLSVGDYIKVMGHWLKVKTIAADSGTVEAPGWTGSPAITARAFEYGTSWLTTTGYIEDKQGAANEIYDSNDLGDVIETADWHPPYSEISGMQMLSNNCMAHYKNNRVYLSEPGYPFTYPHKYEKYVTGNIKGMGHFDTNLVVLTDQLPWVLGCYDPLNVTKDYIEEPQSSLWPRSVVSGNGFVAFISPDGLFMVSQNGMENITEGIYTKEQWETLLTTSTAYDKEVIAVLYDNKYTAFFKGLGTGFMIDLGTRDSRTFDLGEVAIYDTFRDAKLDTLYILAQVGAKNYVYEWEGSASKLTFSWTSKIFSFESQVLFSSGITPGAYTTGITIKIYIGGVLKATKVVSASKPFRYKIPRGREFYFTYSGTEEAYSSVYATVADELQG